MTENEKLFEIAANAIYQLRQRGDLEYRMNDSEDYLQVSVGAIEEILIEAYKLGKQNKNCDE